MDELVGQFNPSWNAAYFIVIHLSRKGLSDFIVRRLQEFTRLPCTLVREGQLIEKGKIYIGIPNLHLILKNGHTRLGHGPAENRWRPSIDVLFRSAAAAYDSRVTGIILTGLLDDGTSGMWAIKRSGGNCLVQDPAEAEYPDMPLSVLNRMEVDHCVTIDQMGSVLSKLIDKKTTKHLDIPADVKAEAELAEKMASRIEGVQALGEQSPFTCPDCGGTLFQVEKEKLDRFRCFTGHVYTQQALEVTQAENIESTLWVALRMMEERKNLLLKMEMQTRERGFERFAKEHRSKADELQEHVDRLKQMLRITQEGDDT